jgi:hypothetical protein
MMTPTRATGVPDWGTIDAGTSEELTTVRRSGDIVGDQAAFQPADLVAQHEFALLQPLQMQLIDRALLRQAGDHGIEVAMLAPQLVQFAQQGISIDQHTVCIPRKKCLDPESLKQIPLALELAAALPWVAVIDTAWVVWMAAKQPARIGEKSPMSLYARLDALQQRHASLEARLYDEDHRPQPDAETICRLKIEKLQIKDEMERIRSTLH